MTGPRSPLFAQQIRSRLAADFSHGGGERFNLLPLLCDGPVAVLAALVVFEETA